MLSESRRTVSVGIAMVCSRRLDKSWAVADCAASINVRTNSAKRKRCCNKADLELKLIRILKVNQLPEGGSYFTSKASENYISMEIKQEVSL